ncbi:hypothetical protein M2B98_22940, partial [Klebsiella pneumoniae]|nr:hypothetical protein [Klebsiella pneumoniae]
FAGKKSAQIREILINESAWEEMTCLFALSLISALCSGQFKADFLLNWLALHYQGHYDHHYHSKINHSPF